jgi:hypothetical protein
MAADVFVESLYTGSLVLYIRQAAYAPAVGHNLQESQHHAKRKYENHQLDRNIFHGLDDCPGQMSVRREKSHPDEPFDSLPADTDPRQANSPDGN